MTRRDSPFISLCKLVDDVTTPRKFVSLIQTLREKIAETTEKQKQ